VVAVVLSQNTSDKNAFKAFENLKRRIERQPIAEVIHY
jgi:endonuclease III